LPQDKLHLNRKVVRARVRHQLVRRLPQTLAPTLIVSALICFTVWCVLYVAVTTQSQGRVATAMVVLLHLSSLLAFLVFVLHRQIGFLDEILGKLADVVGFWPARHHVFAGLSYRERVVAELDTWMREKARDGSVLIA